MRILLFFVCTLLYPQPNIALTVSISLLTVMVFAALFGTFIPLNSYPASFIMVVNSIPLTALLQNLQSIVVHDSIRWGSFFLSLVLTAVLFIISLIISHKIFRKV